MKDGGVHRTYLKFGSIQTDSDKIQLELTTPTEQAGALIDWINMHNPNPYDYPVPNMIAMAIKSGNEAYIKSIKSDLSLGANLKMDEIDDATNIIDVQINESKTVTKK
jgi:uncharacterized protein involved in tolerance to divalent cations